MSGSGDSERAHDEEAWQAIVEHYGDRAELAAAGDPAPAPEPDSEPPVVRAATYDEEERFVPPVPPPLPRPERKRAIAWSGVFGAPALVLLLLILQVELPSLLDYALLAWFVGGFLYLVATMSRTPREPWDDGSRI